MNRKWLERGGPLVRMIRSAAKTVRRGGDAAVLRALDALTPRRATALDVFFAYRLLLGRSPDAAGFSHHRRRLAQLRPRPEQVAADFLSSGEARPRTPAVGLEVVPQQVDLEGFSIWVDRNDLVIGAHLAKHRTWEPDVTRALRLLLRPGDTFVDVGANIGYFTLLGATLVGARGQVIALEPAPRNLGLLRQSLALNAAHHVEVHPVAAGARAGRADLRLPDAANAGSYTVTGAGAVELGVEVQPIDQLVAGRPVNVVKIDVEGAERDVIAGMRQILETSRPVLLLELSGDGALLEELGARGYAAMEAARFDGTFAAQPAVALRRALAANDGHVDLVVFPAARHRPAPTERLKRQRRSST